MSSISNNSRATGLPYNILMLLCFVELCGVRTWVHKTIKCYFKIFHLDIAFIIAHKIQLTCGLGSPCFFNVNPIVGLCTAYLVTTSVILVNSSDGLDKAFLRVATL